MAEGNGELSMEDKKTEDLDKVERTEDYAKLVDYGLDEKVAGKLDEIYKTGIFEKFISDHFFKWYFILRTVHIST